MLSVLPRSCPTVKRKQRRSIRKPHLKPGGTPKAPFGKLDGRTTDGRFAIVARRRRMPTVDGE